MQHHLHLLILESNIREEGRSRCRKYKKLKIKVTRMREGHEKEGWEWGNEGRKGGEEEQSAAGQSRKEWIISKVLAGEGDCG